MTWRGPGPELDSQDFDDFERETGKPVPDQVKWLLTRVSNGGTPEPDVYVPVYGLEGNSQIMVYELYGINHPVKGLNLNLEVPEWDPDDEARGWPLGYDPFNGQIMLMLKGANAGEVRFMPLEEYQDENATESYLLAHDLMSFIKIMEEHAK